MVARTETQVEADRFCLRHGCRVTEVPEGSQSGPPLRRSGPCQVPRSRAGCSRAAARGAVVAAARWPLRAPGSRTVGTGAPSSRAVLQEDTHRATAAVLAGPPSRASGASLPKGVRRSRSLTPFPARPARAVTGRERRRGGKPALLGCFGRHRRGLACLPERRLG